MIHRFFLLFVVLTTLAACARVLAPDGGAQDITPPRLLDGLSTPSLQTNYRPTEIYFHFDEWIQVKDALKQVVISPPTQKAPQVIVRGKKVQIQFDPLEPWRENTTYTLSMGKAISDRSEGNVVPDLKFIFSTGPVLDSLTARGRLLDAASRQPLEDILILLHREEQDSAITLLLPDYFTRTDKQGAYQLNHLSEGTYRLFALEDRNSNYRYDQPDERLAFTDEPVHIGSGQNEFELLTLPPPNRRLRLLSTDSTQVPGRIVYSFNRKPEGLQLPEALGKDLFAQWPGDTLLYLWQRSGCEAGSFITGSDTLRYPAFSGTAAPPQTPVLNRSSPLPPQAVLLFSASPPLGRIDSRRIILIRDSLPGILKDIQLLADGDSLSILAELAPQETARILFLPGALETKTGASHTDTLALSFRTGATDAWANLRLILDSLPAGIPLLLELTDGKGRLKLKRWRAAVEDITWSLDLPPLEPGDYQVFLSQDRNGNQRWDGADYYRQHPSEPRWWQTLSPLRANWDLELRLTPRWD